MALHKVTRLHRDVMVCHGERGVSKQALQGEGIAAIPQVLGCEGVAELVRMYVFYVRACAKAVERLQQ